MQIVIYGMLGLLALVLLVIIYNRLYFEIHLAHASRLLNRDLKKATKQIVDEFSNELRDVLQETIDAMTEGYEDLAQQLSKLEKE